MDILVFLIPLSFVMGFVNAIAGGGGVFGVPALLALGMPPVNALALNRISDIGYIIGCARNYTRIPEFHWPMAALAILPILIGAIIGANLIVGFAPETLNKIILGAVFIGIFMLLYPFRPKPEGTQPYYLAGIAALFALGLWDGAFGMAGGTFGVLIFVLLFHRSFLSAKSIVTLAAVPETIITVCILWSHSTVPVYQALGMAAAAVAGSFFGSKLAIQKGSLFIRYAMAGMALLMVAKILIVDVWKLTG